MSGTYRSAVQSSASGRIKTENPALVKLLTSDSLTDTTRFVAAEHKSPDLKQHASTNSASKPVLNNSLNNNENNQLNSGNNIRVNNTSNSRLSQKGSPEKDNLGKRPNARYSDANSQENSETEKRPNSRYSLKNSPDNINTQTRPDSRFSVKSEKAEKKKDNSNHSSWGNVDESTNFYLENVNQIEKTDFDIISQGSITPVNIDEHNILEDSNNLDDRYIDKVQTSDSIELTRNSLGKNSPSKIDYLKVERSVSPSFEKAHSRDSNKTPGGTSQNYSYHRLKDSSTSASQQHPSHLARSASELIDAQGGGGFEADSLDIDSGVVPDTTSFLESAPDTGRKTYSVPTPISQNAPVIKSADSSRFRANSRTSQRSVNSATGISAPKFERNESLVSDNGIPPPSNIQYNLPSNQIQDNFSPPRKPDQRKSAVSFKEPVITNYHSHIEGVDTDDWDTPRERVPTPHPSSPKKFQDSLDFEYNSRLSPEPTRELESGIPSALFSQSVPSESADLNNSAKSGSGKPVKKVYIDSPTFTKEEEEEFRFVESRIDEMNDDLEDTVRRIEEQGSRYRQEREAMNEEAARLRAEIQATEGYSNSYNSRNASERYGQRDSYSDNYSKPITHPSDEMESRNYGRQGPNNDYRQDRYQNEYSDNVPKYGNVRDSRDLHNENRYEDRNDERNLTDRNGEGGYARNMGGYSQKNEYSNKPDDQYARRQEDQYARRQDDQYARRQDDQYYDRRGESPSRFQNGDERTDEELQRETEYQEDLLHRVESGQKHDSELVIPRIPVGDEQFRDSLDENAYHDQRNYVRDSLEPAGYGKWGNPPPNPFGQGQGDNAGYLNQKGDRPAYMDDNDTARMELVHPKEPKVDYVEENKFTYGLPQNKSYKTLKIKEKEAEQKLSEIFIQPKKPVKKHKRTIPLSSDEERRPPLSELAANDADGAEGVWAKRSAQLAKHKDGKTKSGSGTIKKSRGLQKYPSDSGLQQTSQGQIHPGQGRMYGTPTRNQYLEPLGYKPQISKEEPRQSPVFRETGSYKRPRELEPIKTEIITDDGQKISVDINLKVLSPTSQRRIRSHPDDAPESGPPFNVHAEVVQKQPGDRRPIGVPYQPTYRTAGEQSNSESHYQSHPSDSRSHTNRQSPNHSQTGSRQYPESQHNRQHQDQPPPQQPQFREEYRPHKYEAHSLLPNNRHNDYEGIDEEALLKQEEALMAELNLSPNPYAKIPPIPIRDELTVPVIVEKGGYAAMYQDNKNKDPNQEPWYQVYTIKDFKKMQKEMRLNRGTLGPDLDNETYKDKMEKRHKQFEYARMVMEKNKNELQDTKKPSFPRKDPQVEETEKSKRKAQNNSTVRALDYAKNVPKPQVKPRPTQYNSYEVASQLSPIVKGSAESKSPTHTQNMDVIDLKKLQQRHEQEKKNVAMMRQNLESVPQKA